MLNLTLHPLWHTALPAYEHAIGVLSLFLLALAAYLLINKTPLPTKPFAKYLMLLQASLTFVDLNYGVLVCPVVLFPVSGGLCYGILCTWLGFSGHVANSSMFFAVTSMGVAVIYCFHFKYVSITQLTGGGSTSASRHTLFRISLFVVYSIPGVLQLMRYQNLDGGPEYVQNEFPSLYYLFENSEFHAIAYDPNQYSAIIIAVVATTTMIMMLTICFVSYFVFSTFHYLSNQSLLSESTRNLQRKTMVLLIIQTLTPLTIELTPFIINAYSITTKSLDPNIANALLFLQLTHTFFHTVILILTTSSYRKSFMFWMRKEKDNKISPTIVTIDKL